MAELPKIDSEGLRLAKKLGSARVSSVVERLRDCHLVFKHKDIAEAADEIERLQAIIQGYKIASDIKWRQALSGEPHDPERAKP